MSLSNEMDQRSLFDVPVLAGELFDPTNRYRIFREKILPAIEAKRKVLAALYCTDNGRPAIDPVLITAVTVLQFLEKLPDRKAVENVQLHLGWKYGLDVELGYRGFHPSSLVNYRKRLVQGGAERIGFDALLGALSEAGLVRSKKQRLDSTHVLAAVAKMSRLEMVRETLRVVLEDLKRRGWASSLSSWPVLQALYLDSQIAWHRLDKQGLKEKFAQAGRDALELIRWMRQQPTPVSLSDKAVLLERVFLEQYELGNEDGPQRRKSEASGVVKNPHDPDAQWASKDLGKTKNWVGYKVQIAETVAEDGKAKRKGEPTEQFITEVTSTEAIASDLDGHRRLETNQRRNGQAPAEELYVDTAYVSGERLAQATKQGRELLGPARPSHNTSAKGLFDADAFDVRISERTAICPAGHASCQCSRLHNQQTGKVDYRFEWAGLCDTCALRPRCTSSRKGRRMLLVTENHDHLQQRRRDMHTEAFQKRMQQRNGIEGTISEFARGGGRRTRYRGLPKTTLANYFHGAAINARRWIRLVQWTLREAEQTA